MRRRRKVSSANVSPATRARYAKRRQNRLARVDNDLTDDQSVDGVNGVAVLNGFWVRAQKAA